MSHSKLKTAEAPVSESLIMICEKCGKKLSSDAEENPARVTSCMDICPQGEIAIGFARTGKPNEFYTIERQDVEGSLDEILEKARQ
jgi:hypothetical protein